MTLLPFAFKIVIGERVLRSVRSLMTHSVNRIPLLLLSTTNLTSLIIDSSLRYNPVMLFVFSCSQAARERNEQHATLRFYNRKKTSSRINATSFIGYSGMMVLSAMNDVALSKPDVFFDYKITDGATSPKRYIIP
jgi:hypothetical protein